MAYHNAMQDISNGLGISVPKHLQSPLFEGYVYPHDYENDYVKQDYLPEDLVGRKYYTFGSNKTEQAAKAYHDYIISSFTGKKK
jgi:putative ATPase